MECSNPLFVILDNMFIVCADAERQRESCGFSVAIFVTWTVWLIRKVILGSVCVVPVIFWGNVVLRLNLILWKHIYCRRKQIFVKYYILLILCIQWTKKFERASPPPINQFVTRRHNVLLTYILFWKVIKWLRLFNFNSFVSRRVLQYRDEYRTGMVHL